MSRLLNKIKISCQVQWWQFHRTDRCGNGTMTDTAEIKPHLQFSYTFHLNTWSTDFLTCFTGKAQWSFAKFREFYQLLKWAHTDPSIPEKSLILLFTQILAELCRETRPPHFFKPGISSVKCNTNFIDSVQSQMH